MVSIVNLNFVKSLYGTYFFIAAIEIVAELFHYPALTLFTRVATPVILSTLYFITSEKQQYLFYGIMVTLLLSTLFFYYENSPLFFMAILSFILQRVFSLLLIFKLLSHKNYLYILITTFPFLLVFFYLASVTNDIPNSEFNILILQSILISVLGGVSITSYLQSDSRHNSWLLISTLLFIGLRFIVFIERYFLSDITIGIYRPIGVILNVFAFFAFYKFVIAAETTESEDLKT